MAVFRIERTRDYTVMSNHHLRNANLSLKAKGRQHPDQCRQTDADPETGCMEFEIAKGRFSFRLTAPYNEERREAARRSARENKATDRLK